MNTTTQRQNASLVEHRDLRLLTYRQAAEVLQVSTRTVWMLVDTEQLKAVRFGRTVRIDHRDLDAFIADAKQEPEGQTR